MVEPTPVPKEEIDQINKDIEDLKSTLLTKQKSEDLDKARKDEREKVEREVALQKQLDEQKKKSEDLEKLLATKEKDAADKIAAVMKKVDDLVASKQPINFQDPFKKEQEKTVELTDAQVASIEEASARAFLGEAYDKID